MPLILGDRPVSDSEVFDVGMPLAILYTRAHKYDDHLTFRRPRVQAIGVVDGNDTAYVEVSFVAAPAEARSDATTVMTVEIPSIAWNVHTTSGPIAAEPRTGEYEYFGFPTSKPSYRAADSRPNSLYSDEYDYRPARVDFSFQSIPRAQFGSVSYWIDRQAIAEELRPGRWAYSIAVIEQQEIYYEEIGLQNEPYAPTWEDFQEPTDKGSAWGPGSVLLDIEDVSSAPFSFERFIGPAPASVLGDRAVWNSAQSSGTLEVVRGTLVNERTIFYRERAGMILTLLVGGLVAIILELAISARRARNRDSKEQARILTSISEV